MALGDLILIGWDGSPSYKEVTAPTVAYEPTRRNESGDTVKKTLKRVLHCRKQDVQAVLQNIIPTNASISYDSPNNGGGTTTISYGGGWNLKSYGEAASALGNYIAEINLTYEKEAVTAFELGLPTGLTMTGANGIGYIKYLGNTLLQFNSENDDIGSSWGVSEFVAFVDNKYKQQYTASASDTGGTNYGVAVPFDVLGVSITFNGRTLKTITPEKTDYENLGFTVSDSYTNSLPDSFETISYTYVDIDNIYKGLRWSVSGNIIKLIFWEITVFEWDVTGLTA